MDLSVIIPVWNDWESVRIVCRDIDASLGQIGAQAQIWIVDDGSTLPSSPEILASGAGILRLRERVGHQRAIAAGLGHLALSGALNDAVVVMDGDGEDRAGDIPRLVAKWRENPGCAVVALRGSRFSSAPFRMCSRIYRALFFLITGCHFNFGNFLLLPRSVAEQLSHCPQTSAHLAASLLHQGIPIVGVNANRGRRHFGRTGMNFPGLAAHAFRSFAVYFHLPCSAAAPVDQARELVALR